MWATDTLALHATDKPPHVYPLERLEAGELHHL
jgi:hypothetical protein